ncbi:hypothetical protein QWY85_03695 [Neolewinella lacunae]|uniref:Uncharacterized protein n=1 Tax=Neolewinella lacunae TaxID=1517758 RepID=A0A923T604_9BACT|nr:hypothetical protein [Neolewinella lacunae]MBC6992890.1 hypothetical protein [Neolewinella lacunae]MDN3633746.1 hypothetical protein [Neolewinella lacunae]
MSNAAFALKSLLFGLWMGGVLLLIDYRDGVEMNAEHVGSTLLFWLVFGFVSTWLSNRSATYLERKNARWKAKRERERQEQMD